MPLLAYALDDPSLPNSTRLTANSPALQAAFGSPTSLGSVLFERAELPAKLRELAVLRASQVYGCRYEWVHHVRIATDAGATNAQIAAIEQGDYREGCFDETEVLVIQLAGEVAADVRGDPATVEALKLHLSPAALVELVYAIGLWGMLARVIETFQVEIEDWAGTVNMSQRRRA